MMRQSFERKISFCILQGRSDRTKLLKTFLEETAKYCKEPTLNGGQHCDFDHQHLDDEKYHDSEFPFPKC